MRLHDKGAKAERDKILLRLTYKALVKEFKVEKPLTDEELDALSNSQLYKITKELYEKQDAKKANRLADKLNSFNVRSLNRWRGLRVIGAQNG